MIDDFVILEKVPRSLPAGSPSPCSAIIDTVRETYDDVGLPRHAGKAVYQGRTGTFWGLQVDGDAGRARPTLSRCIPLLHVLLEVLRLGQASVALLEVLAGSLVSVFQCRRRVMSALEELYAVQRGLPRNAVVVISEALTEELLVCAALVPLAFVDMRLKPSTRVIASDSSSTCEAATSCELGARAVSELQKLALQKGMWNRLLNPVQAYFREKRLLGEEEELPEGQSYTMHPAWEEVVSSKQFSVFGKLKRRNRRTHINIGETQAALEAERLHGYLSPDTFYLHILDSQVALAALVKGRSSSRALNRSSIPWHCASGVRPFYGYAKSALNPGDDPTRGVAVRRPTREAARWLVELERGRPELYDLFLEETKSSLDYLRELPDASELAPAPPLDLAAGLDARRHQRQVKRFKARAEKVQKEEAKLSEAEAAATCNLSFPCRSSEPEGGVGPPLECYDGQGLEGWMLRELESFPEDQFLWSSAFASLADALRRGRGFLDLFSGARGVAKALVRTADCWVLCFDTAHGPCEDLSGVPLQRRLLRLVRAKVFAAMGAGPVCSSFSTAVTPPCRTAEYPGGVPWCSELQQAKNLLGNKLLHFVQDLVHACLQAGVHFWVENPDSSWMWRQTGTLSWDTIDGSRGVGELRTDYCIFGCAWRKRTRFKTSLHVAG